MVALIFILLALIVILNPVLIVIGMALIWLGITSGGVYLIFVRAPDPEDKPKPDTLAALMIIVFIVPFLIKEMWENLGVTVPYSMFWIWAKHLIGS